eukprot:Pgem_evm1s7290
MHFKVPLSWLDPRKHRRYRYLEAKFKIEWVGFCRYNFTTLTSAKEKSELIREVRGGGSIPKFYTDQLSRAERQGYLECLSGLELGGLKVKAKPSNYNNKISDYNNEYTNVIDDADNRETDETDLEEDVLFQVSLKPYKNKAQLSKETAKSKADSGTDNSGNECSDSLDDISHIILGTGFDLDCRKINLCKKLIQTFDLPITATGKN